MILTYGRTLNERFNVIGRILSMGNHAVHPSSNCASIIALHSHLFSLSAIYCVCFAYEDLHLLFFKSLLLRDYPYYIKVKLAPHAYCAECRQRFRTFKFFICIFKTLYLKWVYMKIKKIKIKIIAKSDYS